MRHSLSRKGVILAASAALVLAAVAALGQLHSLSIGDIGTVAVSGQAATSTPSGPRITSLSNIATSSITVNWQAADDTDVHWIYSVKSDGSDGRFRRANSGPPLSTTVTGLEDGTEYWFAVIGIGSPSKNSPKEWFTWSSWDKGTTVTIPRVSLGQGVSVAEGGIAYVTVSTNLAPQSPLIVN